MPREPGGLGRRLLQNTRKPLLSVNRVYLCSQNIRGDPTAAPRQSIELPPPLASHLGSIFEDIDGQDLVTPTGLLKHPRVADPRN